MKKIYIIPKIEFEVITDSNCQLMAGSPSGLVHLDKQKQSGYFNPVNTEQTAGGTQGGNVTDAEGKSSWNFWYDFEEDE